MSSQKTADLIEKDVETIKRTVTTLKKKDEEILDLLLKTKMLLDRQKIEDIKLTVLEVEDDEEDAPIFEPEIIVETWEQKAEQLEQLTQTIRYEFMEILNRSQEESAASN
ncbi:uncharacterized protein LOC134812157 [Bolinopsis microptera]|uniref:uncharacterized protein LOC134812157 n=1 Tax=Bolinopsis microptera TaxID=2820187 RepID=UPI00307A933F